MKIEIDIDENLDDLEVIIKCAVINDKVQKLQKFLSDISQNEKQVTFYQDEKEYYFDVSNILFFETSKNGIDAHTKDDLFNVRYKLYELEELLPAYFMRISKSTILNTHKVYSITKNITSASKVEFYGTHKIVYVSRNYYKTLKYILQERKN